MDLNSACFKTYLLWVLVIRYHLIFQFFFLSISFSVAFSWRPHIGNLIHRGGFTGSDTRNSRSLNAWRSDFFWTISFLIFKFSALGWTAVYNQCGNLERFKDLPNLFRFSLKDARYTYLSNNFLFPGPRLLLKMILWTLQGPFFYPISGLELTFHELTAAHSFWIPFASSAVTFSINSLRHALFPYWRWMFYKKLEWLEWRIQFFAKNLDVPWSSSAEEHTSDPQVFFWVFWISSIDYRVRWRGSL